MRAGGIHIANFGNLKGQGKAVLAGVLIIIVASFFINTVAAAFGVNGTLLTILTFVPTLLGLALLLKAIDVF